MRARINLRATRWLLATGIAFGVAAVQAAGGVTITQSEEASVKVGMSMADVERVLGRPAHVVSYRTAPGPTWTYNVVGAPFGTTEFEVSFGADGKVVWANERILGSTGS